MGKRSDFPRNQRDFYPTPYEAVLPLLPHLTPQLRYMEPCAGDGQLVGHLGKHGHECVYACDIEPQAGDIAKEDVLFFDFKLPVINGAMIITNPPWEREVLHRMIDKFRNHAPTWLLFDSDWMFTAQSKPYLKYCAKIVSVGRVSWMGNGQSGMDNCAWYMFTRLPCPTVFIND